MANNGRVPPPHLRRTFPGGSMVHPDPYGPPIHPPPGGFPLEMLPPEVMEQKFTAQHVEMDKLAAENQRLATTHGTLRQDLATAKHELQLVHAHIADMKAEKEHHTKGLMDKIARMEAELQAAESIKTEYQQAHAEAKGLFAARQELITQAQRLTHDLQMAHSEAQQIPALMSELESVRQEYQHCRATFDYEKKLYSDHLESLQVMEKNYMAMSREVDKLRAELTNSANFDQRTGGPYGGSAGYGGGGGPMGQNAYHDDYGLLQQGQTPLLGGASGAGAGAGAGAVGTGSGTHDSGAGGTSPHVIAQSATGGLGAAFDASKRPGYDVQRGPGGAGYDAHRGPTGSGYDAERVPTGPGYDAQRGPTGSGYDPQRGPSVPGYHPQRGLIGAPAYEMQRAPKQDTQNGPGYGGDKAPGYDGQRPPPTYDFRRDSGNDAQRGSNYDLQKAVGYDPSPQTAVGPQGQVQIENKHNMPAPLLPTRASGGYEAPTRGGNPVNR